MHIDDTCWPEEKPHKRSIKFLSLCASITSLFILCHSVTSHLPFLSHYNQFTMLKHFTISR